MLSLPCATYTGNDPYIFISYSHIDEDRVFPEISTLYECGCRIWFDDGIDPCTEWREGIARAISDSALFIVFITRNSIHSRSVTKEINFAIEENKRFLAVHLEEVALPPGLKFAMGDIQAIMKWRMSADDYLRKIMNALPGECLENPRQILVRNVYDNCSPQDQPIANPAFWDNEPDLADEIAIRNVQFGIRDLTNEFLPEEPLKFPVKVCHEKIEPDDAIQEGSIVFILNPLSLRQLEFKLLLQYNACFVFFKDPATERISLEQHPVKLLLDHKNANHYLGNIRGLHKNVLELHIEQNKRLDFLGIMSSCQPLFKIKRLDFYFKEFPIIQKETLTLDDVFIQEAVKSVKPMDVIRMYLEIIENQAASNFEATNRRNALQKVFPFYKTGEDHCLIKLNTEDLAFLVDILLLEEQDNSIRKAIVIGALTAACAYFVHMGHPMGFHIIMEKLLLVQAENQAIIKYKHIPDVDMRQLKRDNAFLYYHLTCRIPNQYTVALFDMFLIETDPLIRQKYEEIITAGLQYLKRQITELSLMPEVLLWEFKRNQEIGAIAGTIGQITFYMKANLNGDYQAFDEAEMYLKKAVEYAHPAEKNRDKNYLIHCGLTRIVQEPPLEKKKNEMAKKLHNLAMSLGKRFFHTNTYDPFDVMFSASIIAVSNIMVSSELAEALYLKMGFQWGNIRRMMNEASHHYAVFLLVSYLFFAPRKLIEGIPDFQILVQKAVAFFKLNDSMHHPGNMMDLLALKFILAHAWYLSNYRDEKSIRKLENYKLRIENAPIYERWAVECGSFLDDCLSNNGSPLKALRLIYAIPY